MKTCAECGMEFAPRGRQLYCTRRCQLRAHYKRLKADPARYERFLRLGRESYARHPETSAAYAVAWRGANRERVRELNRRQQRDQGTTRQKRTAEVREYVAIIRGDPCVYCGRSMAVVDHIDPIAGGGLHEPDNLAPACRSCNARKRSTPLLFFLLRREPPLKVAA